MADQPDPFRTVHIAWLKRERETLLDRVHEMEAGRFMVGVSSDGRNWTDTTQQSISDAKAKIADLDGHLRKFEP